MGKKIKYKTYRSMKSLQKEISVGDIFVWNDGEDIKNDYYFIIAKKKQEILMFRRNKTELAEEFFWWDLTLMKYNISCFKKVILA